MQIWTTSVKAIKNADKKVGERNHFEITVDKQYITVKLNGETVVEKTDKMFAKSKKLEGSSTTAIRSGEQMRRCLQRQGGLEACSMAFYQERDLGDDGEWDNWRIEGPAFV